MSATNMGHPCGDHVTRHPVDLCFHFSGVRKGIRGDMVVICCDMIRCFLNSSDIGCIRVLQLDTCAKARLHGSNFRK